jgi:hypothetical protein
MAQDKKPKRSNGMMKALPTAAESAAADARAAQRRRPIARIGSQQTKGGDGVSMPVPKRRH